ncbi:MAG TPA: energy transducer TonB [Bacteroidales bacterium]
MNKDKRRGIIGTVVVHIILLVCLFFFALRTPLPLPGEEGVEVNLGYDDSGFGEIQSETPPPIMEEAPPPKRVIYDTPEDEEFVKQNIEETPVIEEKKVVKEPVKEPVKEVVKEPVKEVVKAPVEEKVIEKPVEEPKPVVNTKALYPGTSKTSTSGTSQGNTEGAGDMGKPTGYKDSDNYDGQGGSGNGISYSLGGRGAKFIEKPTASFNEVGTVVVSIWVNREGNVVRAQVSPKGTTIVDANMKIIAVDAAKNSTFVADPNAAELQTGTITYKFVLLK